MGDEQHTDEFSTLAENVSSRFPIEISSFEQKMIIDVFNSRFPRIPTLEATANMSFTENLQCQYWTAPLQAAHFRNEFGEEMEGPTHRMALLVKGQLPEPGDDSEWIYPVCTELVRNCYEVGATHTLLRIDTINNRIVLSDNVEHPEEEVTALLERLNTPSIASTKEGIGGVGLVAIRRDERENAGNLTYSEKEGHIIATFTWSS
jgi:hypothetical protein